VRSYIAPNNLKGRQAMPSEQNRTAFEYVRFSENRSREEAKRIYNQRIKDAIRIYNKHKESFNHRNCPFCDSTRYSNKKKFHECYGVCVCNRCASYFVNPAPSPAALNDYYNNARCNLLLDRLFKKRQEKTSNFIVDDRVKKVIEYIQILAKNKKNTLKILEVGCGSGSFLSNLKKSVNYLTSDKYKVDYSGIDIDNNAIASRVNEDLNLACSSVEEYSNRKERFDIILHFELIEHLVDPASFMINSKTMLTKNGLMIFTTQNQNGLEMVASDYNSFRLLAHSIFPPMHLNAFSTINIVHFAIRCGFNVLELSTPGKLDVDMVTQTKEYSHDIAFVALSELDSDTKGLIQYLVAKLKASSHMLCVLQANQTA
jgi:2-polyprenyl-3-methyl-5-hydroxy-6-metoxy-1,4-benzoquinol methylase